MLFVEGAQLQGVQFERETGTYFLQMRTRAIFVELVPVMSEENEVSLVVQRDNPAVAQLGGLREQTGKHAPDSMAEHRVEVIHDQFGMDLGRRCSVIQNVLAQLD